MKKIGIYGGEYNFTPFFRIEFLKHALKSKTSKNTEMFGHKLLKMFLKRNILRLVSFR